MSTKTLCSLKLAVCKTLKLNVIHKCIGHLNKNFNKLQHSHQLEMHNTFRDDGLECDQTQNKTKLGGWGWPKGACENVYECGLGWRLGFNLLSRRNQPLSNQKRLNWADFLTCPLLIMLCMPNIGGPTPLVHQYFN